MVQSPQSYPGRPIVTNLILLPSVARTETGNGDAVSIEGFAFLLLQLDATAAATETEDTLDVFLQTTIDGTNWVDIYHFTQVLGDGGEKRYFAKLAIDGSLTEVESGVALAENASRSIFGDTYRVRWEITDSGTDNATFTFSVKANAT